MLSHKLIQFVAVVKNSVKLGIKYMVLHKSSFIQLLANVVYKVISQKKAWKLAYNQKCSTNQLMMMLFVKRCVWGMKLSDCVTIIR